MFHRRFDKEITNNRFQESYNVKYRNKMFVESSKSRGIFRTQANIYNGVFLSTYLTAYYKKNIQ